MFSAYTYTVHPLTDHPLFVATSISDWYSPTAPLNVITGLLLLVASLFITSTADSRVRGQEDKSNDFMPELLAQSLPNVRLQRLGQSLNILFISLTMPVLKPLKSKLVREEQLLNIKFIQLTLLVSKLLKSKLVKDLQLSNIFIIFVTLLVLKPLTSKLVREEQP